jgi:hypothetical protein
VDQLRVELDPLGLGLEPVPGVDRPDDRPGGRLLVEVADADVVVEQVGQAPLEPVQPGQSVLADGDQEVGQDVPVVEIRGNCSAKVSGPSSPARYRKYSSNWSRMIRMGPLTRSAQTFRASRRAGGSSGRRACGYRSSRCSLTLRWMVGTGSSRQLLTITAASSRWPRCRVFSAASWWSWWRTPARSTELLPTPVAP